MQKVATCRDRPCRDKTASHTTHHTTHHTYLGLIWHTLFRILFLIVVIPQASLWLHRKGRTLTPWWLHLVESLTRRAAASVALSVPDMWSRAEDDLLVQADAVLSQQPNWHNNPTWHIMPPSAKLMLLRLSNSRVASTPSLFPCPLATSPASPCV